MTATPILEPLIHFSASIAGIVATAAPSVVSVHAKGARSSGFIWKPGLIVTADEALAEEGAIAVTFGDGRQVPATVAGRDPTTDVTLLRAETGDAPAISLDGSTPSAGSLVVAVGSQDGHPVAAIGGVGFAGPGWRSMRGGEIDARIDLDLSLRRHAEGGVALDAGGQAFGMAVFGPRRRILVIPGATITRVATQLETRGKVARGYLGLGLQPVRLDGGDTMGAMVMSVDGAGPGAKAGVRQGDIIAAWDGRPIGSVGALLRALGPASVGGTVAVSLRRGGESSVIDLVIGERP